MRKMASKRSTVVVILLIWFVSITLSSPFISYSKYQVYPIEDNDTLTSTTPSRTTNIAATISVCFNDRNAIYLSYYLTSFITMFIFFPTLALAGLNSFIVIKLRRLMPSFSIAGNATVLAKGCKGAYGGTGTTGNSAAAAALAGASVQPPLAPAHEAAANKYKRSYFGRANDAPQSYSMRIVKSQRGEETSPGLTGPTDSVDEQHHQQQKQHTLEQYKHRGNICTVIKDTRRGVKPSLSTLNVQYFRFKNQSISTKRQQVITICLMLLAFYFCQIPIKIFQLYNNLYEMESSSEEYRMLNGIFLGAKSLFYLHILSNPIIFNFMSANFNKSFTRVVFCRRKSNTCDDLRYF